jgi:transcriptional regulator with XRE-family HTH domain
MGTGTDRAIWLRKRLRAARKSAKMSQQQVADYIKADLGLDSLSKQAISQWETFVAQPTVDALASWARAVNLRLRINLVEPGDDRVLVPVRREHVEAVERMEESDDLTLVPVLVRQEHADAVRSMAAIPGEDLAPILTHRESVETIELFDGLARTDRETVAALILALSRK